MKVIAGGWARYFHRQSPQSADIVRVNEPNQLINMHLTVQTPKITPFIVFSQLTYIYVTPYMFQ